jgi:hypothetical protein
MKKVLFIAIVVVFSMALAGVSFAGVVSSSHDLAATTGSNAGNTGTIQPCVFCHHPHRGNATAGNGGNDLLWNLNVPTAAMTAYQQSGTMDATTAAVGAAAPQSFLCMSCHSGTVAQASLLVQSPIDGIAANTDLAITGIFDLIGGSQLQDDHPVNFDYVATAADAGIESLAVDSQVTGNSTGSIYPLFGAGGAGNDMQCATCHDVHAGDNSSDPAIQFMRANTDESQICVDCHINK